eukprot:5044294-Amphidinium_carterae.1
MTTTSRVAHAPPPYPWNQHSNQTTDSGTEDRLHHAGWLPLIMGQATHIHPFHVIHRHCGTCMRQRSLRLLEPCPAAAAQQASTRIAAAGLLSIGG